MTDKSVSSNTRKSGKSSWPGDSSDKVNIGEKRVEVDKTMLDWYEFETWIRKTIFDLVEPNVESISQHGGKIQEMRTQQDQLTEWVHQLETMVYWGRPDFKTALEQVYDTILQNESDWKVVQTEIK